MIFEKPTILVDGGRDRGVLKLSLATAVSFQSLHRRFVRRKAGFCGSKGWLMNGQLIHENRRHVVLGAWLLSVTPLSQPKSSRPPATAHCIIQRVPLYSLSDNDLFSQPANTETNISRAKLVHVSLSALCNQVRKFEEIRVTFLMEYRIFSLLRFARECISATRRFATTGQRAAVFRWLDNRSMV